jgi:hypothetical protein
MPFPILPLSALTLPVPTVEKDFTPGASSSLGNCRKEQTKKDAGVGSKINTSEFMMASTEALIGLKVSKQTITLWKKVRWLK